MKVQFYLLILSLLLTSFTNSNTDKGIDYSLSYYKITDNSLSNFPLEKESFKKIPNSKSLGYKNGDYWFKLKVKNLLDLKNLVGYIPTHNIDKIDLYYLENNTLKHISSTGNGITKDQLPVDYKFPAFKINLEKSTTYYLKVYFPKEANFPLKIITEKEFLRYRMNKKTVNSLYYGTAIIIILLNLFLFFKSRDKAYLLYLLFLTSLMINFLLYDGSLINMFRSYNFYYKLEMIIHLSNEIWFLLFSIKFLNLNSKHPRTTRLFFLFPITVVVFYLLTLSTNNYLFTAIGDTVGIILFPILWCFGIYYIKQISFAKFYVFGYLLIVPFAVFFIIGYPFGLWNVNGDMTIVKIASWLDILVFTYAITYRVKINEMSNSTQQTNYIDNKLQLNTQPKLVESYFSLLKENTLDIEPLTLREIDILDLICEGLNNIEIGNKLFISRNTVKYHVKNIYTKAKVKNRDELKEKLSSDHKCKTTNKQVIITSG